MKNEGKNGFQFLKREYFLFLLLLGEKPTH